MMGKENVSNDKQIEAAGINKRSSYLNEKIECSGEFTRLLRGFFYGWAKDICRVDNDCKMKNHLDRTESRGFFKCGRSQQDFLKSYISPIEGELDVAHIEIMEKVSNDFLSNNAYVLSTKGENGNDRFLINALRMYYPLPIVLQDFPLWNREDSYREFINAQSNSLDSKYSASDLDEDNLYVNKIGNGPQAVIMLHGICMSSSFWSDGLLKYLNQNHLDNFTFFCPDLLGYGFSKNIKSLSDYSRKEQASLVFRDVILRYQIYSYHLVGHSFGALICLDIASQRPEAVKTVVLLSPAYFESEEQAYQILTSIPFPVSHCVAYPELGRYMIRILNSLRPWLAPIASRIIPGSELPELLLWEFFSIDPISTLSTVKSIVYDRVDNCLEKLMNQEIRICVAHGDRDGVVPLSQGKNLAQRYSNIDLRVLPGMVHHFPVSHAKLSAHIVLHELLHFNSKASRNTWIE